MQGTSPEMKVHERRVDEEMKRMLVNAKQYLKRRVKVLPVKLQFTLVTIIKTLLESNQEGIFQEESSQEVNSYT